MGINYTKGSIHYGYVLPTKVPFKTGPFSNPRHTHPGILILESPPPPLGDYLILGVGYDNLQVFMALTPGSEGVLSPPKDGQLLT